MTTFKDFSLPQAIQATLDTLGFTTPTEIQEKAIPYLLKNQGADFHGQAQTGTGKTLAFGLPLLQRIDASKMHTQALVVAPTRELAQQISDSISPFARALNIRIEAIYGGASMEEQMRNLRRGAHIIIGTPGRLNDHLRRKTLNLSNIKTLVLDEADIMLDMGFKDEVDEILSHAPAHREIWLFSATTKSGINKIMSEHMKNTMSVRVAKKVTNTPVIKQYYCIAPMRLRLQALCRFIENAPEFYGFIFCPTKILTGEIAEQLIRRGYKVGALHGDLSQGQRNITIKKFKNKELSIVVATDVAARGIDIPDITHVINYSLPEDQESYVHRIGRTGRAGKEGISITFINKSEQRHLEGIKYKFNFEIAPINAPSRESITQSRIAQAQKYITSISVQSQEINTELVAMIQQYSHDELRAIVSRMLSDTYLASINAEEDISMTPATRNQPDIQEFCIAVGTDDDISYNDVMDYLIATTLVTPEQIRKIRVIQRRTFVEVDRNVAQPLLEALRNAQLKGRRVSINLVEAREEEGQSSYRSQRGGDRGDRRQSNDRRPRSRSSHSYSR